MSPPGATPTLSSMARRADKAATAAVDPALRRRLVDAGCWVAAERGRPMRRARVRELVDRFLIDGRSDLLDDSRTVDSFASWVITYADPTGETAVRRAMRRG